MGRGRLGILYALSFVLHAGGALAVVSIEVPEVHESTRITIREHKPKTDTKKQAEPPPPPPPIVVAPKLVRRAKAPAPEAVAPAPAPAAAAAAPAPSGAPVADFGLSMTGATGSGGIAVPVAAKQAAPPRATKTVAPRALAKAAAPSEDSCLEELIKPKPISIPQPVYAERAREAGIVGKVRVELTIDETGAVVATKLIEALGYGLDEAALDAARNARFNPATRCGKPARTSFVIGIRFSI